MKTGKLERRLRSTPISAEDRAKLTELISTLFDEAKQQAVKIIDQGTEDSGAKATLGRIQELLSISSSASNRPMSSTQAAEYMGVSVSFLHRLTSRSEIPHFKSKGGGKLSFTKADCDSWLLHYRVKTKEEIEKESRDE